MTNEAEGVATCGRENCPGFAIVFDGNRSGVVQRCDACGVYADDDAAIAGAEKFVASMTAAWWARKVEEEARAYRAVEDLRDAVRAAIATYDKTGDHALHTPGERDCFRCQFARVARGEF